jgi:ABC-type nickel/cobalt efflux system permease component RcnA
LLAGAALAAGFAAGLEVGLAPGLGAALVAGFAATLETAFLATVFTSFAAVLTFGFSAVAALGLVAFLGLSSSCLNGDVKTETTFSKNVGSLGFCVFIICFLLFLGEYYLDEINKYAIKQDFIMFFLTL